MTDLHSHTANQAMTDATLSHSHWAVTGEGQGVECTSGMVYINRLYTVTGGGGGGETKTSIEVQDMLYTVPDYVCGVGVGMAGRRGEQPQKYMTLCALTQSMYSTGGSLRSSTLTQSMYSTGGSLRSSTLTQSMYSTGGSLRSSTLTQSIQSWGAGR